jgi:hypothetical protein
MNALVNGARSRSTLLTAAAGLLLLMTAVVMMVCAAPKIHQARGGSVARNQLAAWVWVSPDSHGSRAVGPVAHIPNGVRP